MKFETVEDLIFALINEIGLSIKEGGIIVDQDTLIPLKFGDKNIKASVDVNKPVYESDYTVVLDPLNNMKLMNMLLGYYLEKEKACGNLEPITFSTDELVKHGPTNVTVRCGSSKVSLYDVSSRYYNNRCLKFSDIILKLGNDRDVDLSNFDSVIEEEEVVKNPRTRRK